MLSPASLWLVDEPLSALDPTRGEQAIGQLLAIARERNLALLTTMHQVDTALAHFPRIVGLRDGAIVFDLAAGQVSSDHLQRLYAQREHELHGAADRAPPKSAPPPPATMHCR